MTVKLDILIVYAKDNQVLAEKIAEWLRDSHHIDDPEPSTRHSGARGLEPVLSENQAGNNTEFH